jgi:hypothetical protein
MAYLLRAAFITGRLYEKFEFPFVQRIQIFYSALHGYIALITLLIEFQVIDSTALAPIANSLFIFVGGAIVSWIFSRQLSLNIGQRLLSKTQWGG